jgi:hypothetical protein
MVSLKMTPKEAKAEGFGSPTDIKPPEYPWGTSLTLTNETAKELFPNGLPDVGTEFKISGTVRVKGKNENQQEGEDVRTSIDLQVTDLDVPNTVPKKDAAATLYPNMASGG